MTLSPRSIEVTWNPPVANVDDVDGYIISYDAMGGFADDDSVSISGSSTRATIDELEEFVSYDITVLAVYNTITVSSTSSVRVMTWSDGKYICRIIRLSFLSLSRGVTSDQARALPLFGCLHER